MGRQLRRLGDGRLEWHHRRRTDLSCGHAGRDAWQQPRPLGVREGEGLVRAKVCALSGGPLSPECPTGIDEWLPPGPRHVRSMHERVAIDARNQLRAGPSCLAKFVEMKSFERFDGELAVWAKGAHRSTAPAEFSPLCPGKASGAIQIGYPADGTRFVIDPGVASSLQIVDVRIGASAGAKPRLFIDGEPSSTRWQLAPGLHVLVARADGFSPSAEVRIDVAR